MDLAGLDNLQPRDVLFWSGAGISIDPPTDGPSGDALTRRALDQYFSPDLNAELEKLYIDLLGARPPGRPRLETVLDVLWKRMGQPALDDVLSDLVVAEPNPNHRFFADHLMLGGGHVTANFDTLIERARVGTPVSPFHFHGEFGPNGETDRLGARLSVIEHGFPEPLREALLDAVDAVNPRAIVFVGYSGSDYFDVLPFFQSNADRIFGGREVYWVTWRPTIESTRLGVHPDSPTYLALASDAGASAVELQMPLRPILERLASVWAIALDRTPAPAPGRPWIQLHMPSPDEKRHATFALLATIGARKQAARYFIPAGVSEKELDLMADVEWGRGRFRQALRYWRRAMPRTAGVAPVKLREREAAVWWVQGRYLKAERSLWRLLAELRSDARTDRRMIEKVAETYARVTGQMMRMPDLRKRVDPIRVTVVADLLELAQRDRTNLGIGRTAKVQSAWADLARVANSGPLELQSIAFEQSESLHGMLNHRQGRIRADAASAIDVGAPLPSADEYRRLYKQNLVLGARGDAARVPMIPGSEAAFGIVGTAYALLRAQFTTWHRIRVLGEFSRRRLRFLYSRRR